MINLLRQFRYRTIEQQCAGSYRCGFKTVLGFHAGKIEIPAYECHRVLGVVTDEIRNRRIIGVGYGKTGTKSLRTMITAMGYNHKSIDHVLLENYEKRGFDSMVDELDRYDSFEDFPWPFHCKEIDERYPNSKFILSVREDPETWVDSLARHSLRYQDNAVVRMCLRISYGLEDPSQDRKGMLNRYLEHNEAVREYFRDKPGKLLEICWETGSSWDDVCAFLDHPPCGRELPHENRNPIEREKKS